MIHLILLRHIYVELLAGFILRVVYPSISSIKFTNLCYWIGPFEETFPSKGNNGLPN